MDAHEYARGMADGYEGHDANLFREQKNYAYLDGYTDGKARRLAEHRENVSIIFESAGQSAYARRGRVGS